VKTPLTYIAASRFATSTLVEEFDIAGEDGQTKGGEGQDVRKRAIR